jgi:hypothetical protein
MPQRWRPPLHFVQFIRPGAVNCAKSAMPDTPLSSLSVLARSMAQSPQRRLLIVQVTGPWRGRLHIHTGTGYSLRHCRSRQTATRARLLRALQAAPGAGRSARPAARDQPLLAPAAGKSMRCDA